MIQNTLELKENVTKKPYKYLATHCTFTVRVMESGTPMDLKADVFVKRICRIMTGYAKVMMFLLMRLTVKGKKSK